MRLLHILFLTVAAITPMSSVAVEGRDYPSSMGYSSQWMCEGKGRFSWYCEDEPAPEKEEIETNAAHKPKDKPAETREELAVKELDQIRKDLDAKRALSVVHPTEENVKAYIAAQKVEIERANYYADVWRRVVWQTAALNFELKRPMNNSAIKVKNRERDKDQTEVMRNLSKDWGIFFFFRGDCTYCKHMVPILQWVTRQYDMTIMPISMDGTTIDGLPPSVNDNGMSKQLGVEAVPLYVLGNVKTHKMVILGSGVLSLQDFVERIYVLTQTSPGDL